MQMIEGNSIECLYRSGLTATMNHGVVPLDSSIAKEISLMCTVRDIEDIDLDLGFISRHYPSYQQIVNAEFSHYDNVLDDAYASHVIQSIRTTPDSRKLYFNFWSEEHLHMSVKSPCLVGIHFRVFAGDILNMQVVMRANNAATIFPINLVIFLSFFKRVAHGLRLSVGQYHHYATSFHIYSRDLQYVANFCNFDI